MSSSLWLAGCSGEESAPVAEGAAEEEKRMLAPELVDESWVVKLATNDALGPFVSHPGWATYVMKRDYKGAIKAFGANGGQPLARVHEDAASLYRQAALLAAHAFIETYGETPSDGDPAGTAHLLTVSYSILGDLESARASAAKMATFQDDPTLVWHKPWAEWLGGAAEWPPDLSSLPVEVMEPTPGQWPGVGELPHYQLPEQTAEKRLRDMADPGILVSLALWHSAAARAAAPDEAGRLDTYSSRYRLPVEGAMASGTEALPIEYLFGSDFGFIKDAAFLNSASKDSAALAEGGSVEKDGSGLEAMVLLGMKDGAMDSGNFADAASNYRDLLVERAAVKTNGSVQGFHRTFAGMARVGALRTAAEFAQAKQDQETSGKLRILAMEAEGSMETSNNDYVSSPLGMLSLAAWDAGNRFPTRGQEIIHNLAKRYESLEAARYALDVLALRVSRSGAGDSVGM
jgi:hypothetical protein